MNYMRRKDYYDLGAADAAAEVPVKDATPIACTNLQSTNQWWWWKEITDEYNWKGPIWNGGTENSGAR